MKKRQLEMILQKLEEVPTPDPYLEQYPTPADIGADLIFRAYSMGDVREKTICEPACGKGLLVLGAAIMGATEITGFDLDRKAVMTANRNKERLQDQGYEIKGKFFTGSLPEFSTTDKWDTIIMNPPFGSQKPGADRPFLDFAVGHSTTLYSLHMARTENFVVNHLKSLGFASQVLGYYTFPIKHTFSFHTKEKMDFKVVLVRATIQIE